MRRVVRQHSLRIGFRSRWYLRAFAQRYHFGASQGDSETLCRNSRRYIAICPNSLHLSIPFRVASGKISGGNRRRRTPRRITFLRQSTRHPRLSPSLRRSWRNSDHEDSGARFGSGYLRQLHAQNPRLTANSSFHSHLFAVKWKFLVNRLFMILLMNVILYRFVSIASAYILVPTNHVNV